MPHTILHSELILTIKELLDSKRCQQLIDLAEQHGFADAPVTTYSGPQINKDLRNNERVIIDSVDLADELWTGCKPYVADQHEQAEVLGLNERFRFYRYDPGQRFNWHYDGYYERQPGERSHFTLMFYLNADFTGGTTDFRAHSITPGTGDALIFWHHLKHRGAPVLSGRKYVLRTDIMYRDLPNRSDNSPR